MVIPEQVLARNAELAKTKVGISGNTYLAPASSGLDYSRIYESAWERKDLRDGGLKLVLDGVADDLFRDEIEDVYNSAVNQFINGLTDYALENEPNGNPDFTAEAEDFETNLRSFLVFDYSAVVNDIASQRSNWLRSINPLIDNVELANAVTYVMDIGDARLITKIIDSHEFKDYLEEHYHFSTTPTVEDSVTLIENFDPETATRLTKREDWDNPAVLIDVTKSVFEHTDNGTLFSKRDVFDDVEFEFLYFDYKIAVID